MMSVVSLIDLRSTCCVARPLALYNVIHGHKTAEADQVFFNDNNSHYLGKIFFGWGGGVSILKAVLIDSLLPNSSITRCKHNTDIL